MTCRIPARRDLLIQTSRLATACWHRRHAVKPGCRGGRSFHAYFCVHGNGSYSPQWLSDSGLVAM
jgi:hypothetical protein